LLEKNDQEHDRGKNDEIPHQDREKYVAKRLFFMQAIFIDRQRNHDPERKEKKERGQIGWQIKMPGTRLYPDENYKSHGYDQDVDEKVYQGSATHQFLLLEDQSY